MYVFPHWRIPFITRGFLSSDSFHLAKYVSIFLLSMMQSYSSNGKVTLFPANNNQTDALFKINKSHTTTFFKAYHILSHKKLTQTTEIPKKNTTFVFNNRSVTSMWKYPITQHIVSDSGHSTKWLKESGTTRICKTMKYNNLHLSLHSVYLLKRRLYRLKWIVTDNQWCKYAASANNGL